MDRGNYNQARMSLNFYDFIVEPLFTSLKVKIRFPAKIWKILISILKIYFSRQNNYKKIVFKNRFQELLPKVEICLSNLFYNKQMWTIIEEENQMKLKLQQAQGIFFFL